MIDDAVVSGLLASRICHDLVSPVGAIVNGTDLIREIGGAGVEDEIAMISQSAERASALLQFYRIAFGAADDDAILPRSMLEAQAAQMLVSPKLDVQWEGLGGPALMRAEGRLLFQMLMCGRAAVGMRGRLVVRLDLEASFPMSMTILPLGGAPGAPSMNHDALRLFSTPPGHDEVTARQIEFALLHRSLQDLQVRIGVSIHGDGARVEATKG